MLSQIISQYTTFLIIVSFIGLGLCLSLFIIPLIYKKIKRTQEKEANKGAFFFSVSNLAITLMQIPILIGLFNLLNTGGYTYIYWSSISFALILSVISALFLFLFTHETFGHNKIVRYTIFILGCISLISIVIYVVIILQEQLNVIPMSVMIASLYLLLVYSLMTFEFYKLYKKTEGKVKKVKVIFIGSILMVLFVILISIGGPFMITTLGKISMIAGFATSIAAASCFFYGFIIL